MKLEQSFTVQAPIATVWAALVDVERVAPCLPGAQITEAGEDGSYKGTFTVKLGPTTAAYNGSLRMQESDESSHRATMSAKGTDKRGQGGATATIVSTLAEDGDGTRVDVVTDFSITGRLARFGRSGMIEDISNRLLRDFASCLQAQLEGDQASGGAGGPGSSSAGADAAAVAEAGATGPEAATKAAAASVPPSSPAPPSGTSRSSSAPAAKPISGLSLFFGALMDRLRRLFRRRT